MALNTVAAIQALYLLNCCSLRHSLLSIGLFRNGWLWFGIAAVLLLQVCITYVPFLNAVFRTAPIGWGEWVRIAAASLAVVVAVEALKSVFPKSAPPAWARSRAPSAEGAAQE